MVWRRGVGHAWQYFGIQGFWVKLAHASGRSHILAPHFMRIPFVIKYKGAGYVCICVLNPPFCTFNCSVMWVPIPSCLLGPGQASWPSCPCPRAWSPLSCSSPGPHPFEAVPKKLYPSVPAGISLSLCFTGFSTPIDTSEQRCSH